MAFAEQEEQK